MSLDILVAVVAKNYTYATDNEEIDPTLEFTVSTDAWAFGQSIALGMAKTGVSGMPWNLESGTIGNSWRYA